MRALLLDTRTWVHSLARPEALSDRAAKEIGAAEAVFVSPISFLEIGQVVRLGLWPEMAPHAARLDRVLSEQGGQVAPFTPEIALRASLMDWDHRDPFDRVLAATSDIAGLPIVTDDPAFATLPGLHRVW